MVLWFLSFNILTKTQSCPYASFVSEDWITFNILLQFELILLNMLFKKYKDVDGRILLFDNGLADIPV